MTVRGVISEAWRNISTGTTWAILWAVAVSVFLSLLLLSDIATIRRIEHDVHTFQAAEANVRKMVTDGQVDGSACSELTRVSTVQASGAIREAEPLEILQSPNVPLTAFEVSVGMGSVIGVEDPDPVGVWVEEGLAKSLMVTKGDILTSRYASVPVAGIFNWPDDGRDARFGFSALIPVASGSVFDECWLKAWPVVGYHDQLLRSTVLVSAAPVSMQITQLNKSLGTTLDAHRLFYERVTQHVQWVAPLVMFVIGFVSVRRRRLEYAAALHARQPRGALLLGVVLETSVWAATGAFVSLVVSMASIRSLGLVQGWPVWLLSVRIVCASQMGAIVGALLGAVLIREANLFRYFRTR